MALKLLIVTNQPAPYRVDFFFYLQQEVRDYEIHILFQSENKYTSRQWEGGEEKLSNVHFLKSKIITKRGDDIQDKMLPRGVGKAISGIGPDVVVCHEYNAAALLTLLWCRRHHVPYISWTDGTRHSERNIRTYQKWCRSFVVKRAAAFIAASSKARENQIYLGANPDKCFLSILSIDRSPYEVICRKERSGKRLLTVGSLIKRKGNDLLIAALARILDMEWELEIVGEGPEKEGLLKEAEKLGFKDRLRLLGYLSGQELVDIYSSADIFILPTREDCFGLVTLEAMCCGLPVISSKYADSAYDLIEEGSNGLIVDPFNPEEMAAALRSLLSDREKMLSYGAASRMRARNFSFSNTYTGFMEAVRSVNNI